MTRLGKKWEAKKVQKGVENIDNNQMIEQSKRWSSFVISVLKNDILKGIGMFRTEFRERKVDTAWSNLVGKAHWNRGTLQTAELNVSLPCLG